MYAKGKLTIFIWLVKKGRANLNPYECIPRKDYPYIFPIVQVEDKYSSVLQSPALSGDKNFLHFHVAQFKPNIKILFQFADLSPYLRQYWKIFLL